MGAHAGERSERVRHADNEQWHDDKGDAVAVERLVSGDCFDAEQVVDVVSPNAP